MLRVCAVSYLNTVPLIWGLTRGPLQGVFDLSFEIPSVCADKLASGAVDIGLVPCAELDPLGLSYVPDLGIACRGPVRTILLVTKVDPRRIRTLAADVSSRTSVMLTRIILSERFGVRPEFISMPPRLENMLEWADAALIIGDPALHVDPASLPYSVLDLGAEWVGMTGLPMVFAVWAGRAQYITPEVRRVFLESYEYGAKDIERIAAEAETERGFPREVAREYLTKQIVFELGDKEHRGIELFRSMAAQFRTEPAPAR